MTFFVRWVEAVVAVNGATVTGTERHLGNDAAGRTDAIMYFPARRGISPPRFVQPLFADHPAVRAPAGGVTKPLFCEISLLRAGKNEPGAAITADQLFIRGKGTASSAEFLQEAHLPAGIVDYLLWSSPTVLTGKASQLPAGLWNFRFALIAINW